MGRRAVRPFGNLVAPLAGGSASWTHRDGFARYRNRGGRSCIGNAPRLSLQHGHAHLRETVLVAHALATLSLLRSLWCVFLCVRLERRRGLLFLGPLLRRRGSFVNHRCCCLKVRKVRSYFRNGRTNLCAKVCAYSTKKNLCTNLCTGAAYAQTFVQRFVDSFDNGLDGFRK